VLSAPLGWCVPPTGVQTRTAAITMTQPTAQITVGVDTHKTTHTASAVDQLGRLLGHAEFAATPTGHAALTTWAGRLGRLGRFGVEGTGSYGAGLARHLRAAGLTVIEVDRPDRRTRRQQGKSDPSTRWPRPGRCWPAPPPRSPRPATGRWSPSARCASLVGMPSRRAQAANQLHHLVVDAPEPLRSQLRPLSLKALVVAAASWQPAAPLCEPANGVAAALGILARRYQQLSADIAQLDGLLRPLVAKRAPALLAINGVGVKVAAQLLVTAGDNPDRLRNQAAFARLCGVAPLPASSGKPNGTGSAAAVTGRPTVRFTASS
jgi:transposase